ncbi:phosphonoacetaldehyde reductase [Roseovarius aestuarii]|nr:phosphonoacetaldehyde reductase [Roseovarius aestuarii]
MWSYCNPVDVSFGAGAFEALPKLINGRRYAIITYPDAPFEALTQSLQKVAGAAVLVINDIAPNPDFRLLGDQCARFDGLPQAPEVLVALGGGSVIDSAKVYAAALGDFRRVQRFLETKEGGSELGATPIIAVPTTAGTGSEVTHWATVWDEQSNHKYSLALLGLYPEHAVVDPALMLGKPAGLTLATGLDALSHALESIWNINANPVSARHAVFGAKTILRDLPALMKDLGNLDLRSSIAEASLAAGLAFSNTKTSIAHNLSYPMTLGWHVQHGIACSFTLPVVLESVKGIGGFREDSLKDIFGPDLGAGAQQLTAFLAELGVGHRMNDHGVPSTAFRMIVDEAFAGERGRNFVGQKENFLNAANRLGVI